MNKPTFLLVPQPRSVRWLGGWVGGGDGEGEMLSNIEERVGKQAECTLAGQSYLLRIEVVEGAPKISIHAGGTAGLRYAQVTLAQLQRQFGGRLPTLEIEDEPTFAVRGLMLDISRCRVPTMMFLHELVRTLYWLKMNHLQLYTEHTFAYLGHERVWAEASPMTAAEIVELDHCCRRYGIELAANQNVFGHMERWLIHERYERLAEIGEGEIWDLNGFPMRGPFSLNPTDPRSLALVTELLGQLLPCFSSNLVNIGCDETLDVGQGRAREVVARKGRGRVYVDYVNRVMARVRSAGKRPMFWGDIALSEPAILSELGSDAVALAWGYEADAPFGDWCDTVHACGLEDVWVCPGTSSWRSITGRTDDRRRNLAQAARQGEASGASGYLITDWGDMGHRQQWPISLLGIAEGAGAAWNGRGLSERVTNTERAVSLQIFGDTGLAIGGWLGRLGDVDLEMRAVCGMVDDAGEVTRLRNSTVLFNALHPPSAWFTDRTTPDDWERVRVRLNDLGGDLPKEAGADILDELGHTLEVAKLACGFGEMAIAGQVERSAGQGWMKDCLEGVIDDHRRLWLRRSRIGGLDESTAHYEGLYDRIEQMPKF